MADEPHKIEIETVAEVTAVDRETVEVLFHADEQIIHLMKSSPYGDLHSITFPVGKAQAVCDAILQLAGNARG